MGQMEGVLKGLSPFTGVLRVFSGAAFFWTLADNMKETEIERIKF